MQTSQRAPENENEKVKLTNKSTHKRASACTLSGREKTERQSLATNWSQSANARQLLRLRNGNGARASLRVRLGCASEVARQRRPVRSRDVRRYSLERSLTARPLANIRDQIPFCVCLWIGLSSSSSLVRDEPIVLLVCESESWCECLFVVHVQRSRRQES